VAATTNKAATEFCGQTHFCVSQHRVVLWGKISSQRAAPPASIATAHQPHRQASTWLTHPTSEHRHNSPTPLLSTAVACLPHQRAFTRLARPTTEHRHGSPTPPASTIAARPPLLCWQWHALGCLRAYRSLQHSSRGEEANQRAEDVSLIRATTSKLFSTLMNISLAINT